MTRSSRLGPFAGPRDSETVFERVPHRMDPERMSNVDTPSDTPSGENNGCDTKFKCSGTLHYEVRT